MGDPKPCLLVVDDIPSNIYVMRRILEPLNLEIVEASSGQAALNLIIQQTFFLVLMDVQMPEMNGFEAASLILANPTTAHLPIIFVTAISKDEHFVFKGYQSGAVDYLVKPLNPDIVISKIKVFLQLHKTQLALAHSNEEFRTFAFAASHDLKAPLRRISQFSGFLQQDVGDTLSEGCKKHISRIQSQIVVMHNLIESLLEYARAGNTAINTCKTPLLQCVEEAMIALEVNIQEAGVTITYDVLPEVEADATFLTQLFQNLFANAIKFVEDKKPEIHISANKENGLCTIAVKDNGIGIDEMDLETVFVPFKRLNTQNDFEGSGIGLSTCLKIVRRHGGEIWVESAGIGKGTVFYFTLSCA